MVLRIDGYNTTNDVTKKADHKDQNLAHFQKYLKDKINFRICIFLNFLNDFFKSLRRLINDINHKHINRKT